MKIEGDDWVPDLPALDDGADEEAPGDAHEDVLPAIPEDRGDPLDDSAADDLDGDGAFDLDDQPGADEPDDEREIDVGEPEIDTAGGESGLAAEGDEPGIGDDDLGIDDDLEASADDAGEEGTTDAVEDSISGDLPALDADDDGDFDDSAMLEAGLDEAIDDGQLPRWADLAWDRRGPGSPLPPQTSLVGLAYARGHLLAVGDGAFEVASNTAELRAASWAPARVLSALALHAQQGSLLAVASSGGGLATSTDGGATLTPRAGLGRVLGEVRDPEIAELALTGAPSDPTLWVRTTSGALVRSRDLGATFDEPVRASGVRSLASLADGSLLALVADGSGTELLASSDGARLFAHRLSAGAAVVARSPGARLAAAGGAIAIVGEAGAVVSRETGARFALVPGCAGATAAAFAGHDASAPLLVAVFREAEDRTYLVRSTAEGTTEVVADLGADRASDEDAAEADGLGRVLASLWDDSRKVAWLAGPFGLVALGPTA